MQRLVDALMFGSLVAYLIVVVVFAVVLFIVL
jgi:hypothetical protein